MKKKISLVIIILTILLIANVVYASTLGYTTIGASEYQTGTPGSQNPAGLMITVPSAGTISKISAHVRNNNSTVALAARLYAGSAGSLGSLIATTQTSNVTTSYAWVDFTFATPQSVSATTYWIEFVGDGGNGPGGNLSFIHFDGGGASNTGFTKNDFGVPVYDGNQYSIYATYTATGGSSPTTATVEIKNSSVVITNGGVLIKQP